MAGYRPSLQLRQRIQERDRGVCQRCGCSDGRMEVAHAVPWPEGPTAEDNLLLLCKSCNGKDRRPWGENPRLSVHDFPQTKAEFDEIVNQLLERVLP